MGDFDDNVTVAAAAKILGVSKSRVDQYIKAGRIPVAARAGGLRWLSLTAVKAFAAAPRLKRGPKPKIDPPAPAPAKKGRRT